MEFVFSEATKVYFGQDCILNNSEVLQSFGKRAMIVTGKNSAKACGALEDVVKAVKREGISYLVFDEIENNPSVDSVSKAGKIAKKEAVDFVIGIGGGSPIDAAKAIAVLAVNEIEATDLFKNAFKTVLPIIAIPTTAGTGSEVTSYSVLLRTDIETKVSFGTVDTLPKCAFLDAKYTKTLSKSNTINTAVDAFMHSLEGYLANRSTVISDCLALEGIRVFGKNVRKLVNFEIDQKEREDLLYVSLLGGMVIAHSGVTIAHGMGYCYTYFKDIPHGKGNGLLLYEYLKFNYEVAKEKIDQVISLLGCKTLDEVDQLFCELLGHAPALTLEEVEKYTDLTLIQKGSMTNTMKFIDRDAITYLWRQMANLKESTVNSF